MTRPDALMQKGSPDYKFYRPPSYLDPQQGRVLLRPVNIIIAGIAGHNRTRHHDLDRAPDRVWDDGHLVRRHVIQAPDVFRRKRGRLHNALVVRVGAEHDVQGQPPRAGVLAAYDLRD